jgi:taurine transport system substrate-binding protein
MSPNLSRRRLVGLGALAALALAACGSSASKASSPTSGATATTGAATTAAAPAATTAAATTAAAAVPAKLPDKITIGYQQVPNGDLIVKHEKWLEDALGGKVKIDWKLFDSGGSVNEAVVAGAVDIGLVGSSPASRGLSTKIAYQVPWIFDVIGKGESLVAKGDKGISTIADLKGKTVATPFASTSHYSLLAALQDAGVKESDVKVIDSEPDAIFAAWQKGDIDAAYVWNPNLAKLIKDGGKVLITSEDLAKKGKTTYDLAVVTTKFATDYPDVVTVWAKQQDKAVQLIKSDPTKAAASIAPELNITPDEAKAQLGDLIFVTAAEQVGADYLGGGLAANLFAAANFNKTLGKIPSVEAEDAYKKGVNTTFAAAAAKG